MVSVLNGGFETGDFTNWDTIGVASIQTNTFGSTPTEGNFQALITTEFGSVTDTELETFLGLEPGILDDFADDNAIEGSAIQLPSITVEAGDTVSFDWNFLTNEAPFSIFNDFAFVSISSVQSSELADTSSNLVFSPTLFPFETGYGTFTYTFTTSGTYTIGLGVVDEQDTLASSGLLIDNLQIISPLEGTPEDDFLIDTDGIDVIFGFAGDDTILGLAGNDQIFGGDGDDLITAGSGDDIVDAEAGDDQILGGEGNDVLKGGDGLDVIFGGNGNDQIDAGLGKDRIFAEDGDDQINGGEGDDIINAGLGTDLVSGGEGNDRVFGDEGDDQLSGNAGDDELNGNTGADILNGGSGSDFLFGGSEDDSLIGEADTDTLVGGSGNDYLDGGDGDDRLTGIASFVPTGFGAGEVDILIGGTGSDTFVLGDTTRVYYDDGISFSSGTSDYALILDFNTNEDFIQLRGSANLYSLDFFISSSGSIDANIIYDPGITAVGEVIGVLQNVSTDLNINSPAFVFV